MIDVIVRIILWSIDQFIKDMERRAKLKASFLEFVENRRVRANQTIELKEMHDAQAEAIKKAKEEKVKDETEVKASKKS